MSAVSYPTCKSQDVSPCPHSSDVSQPDLHNTEHEDSALDLSTPGCQMGADDVFSLSPTPASTWSSISSTEDPVVRDYLSSRATSAPSVESGSVSELARSDRLCGFNSKRPHSSTCEPCSEDRYEHDKFTGMIICHSHLDTMQRLSKGDAGSKGRLDQRGNRVWAQSPVVITALTRQIGRAPRQWKTSPLRPVILYCKAEGKAHIWRMGVGWAEGCSGMGGRSIDETDVRARVGLSTVVYQLKYD
jgi:hypothetical protein